MFSDIFAKCRTVLSLRAITKVKRRTTRKMESLTIWHGKFNRLALVTNGFLLHYATAECLGIGYILNAADCELGITHYQRGFVAVATFIGVVSPAIFWGCVGDAIGRRATMLPATVLAVVFSIMSSMSQNFLSLFLLRMATGVMVSASCTTLYVYLGELYPASHRPAAISWGATFIAQAYVMMSVCAWILLPRSFALPVTDDFRLKPWRVLMWLYTLAGTAACVGMAILPESPAFKLATRGSPEARPILAKMYSWNQKKSADEYPVQEVLVNHQFQPSLRNSLNQIKAIVQPPLLRCLIITHICNFLVFMQSNSFYIWMPYVIHEVLLTGYEFKGPGICTILNDVHKGGQEVVPDCAFQPGTPVYLITTVAGVLTYFCFPGILAGRKRYGNKKMFAIVMALCGALLFSAMVVPHITVAIVLYIMGVTSITASTVMVNSVLDVFPIRLRALAMSTLFMCGRLGGLVGAQMFAMGRMSSCILYVATITGVTALAGILMYQWPDNAKVRAEMTAKNYNY